MGRRSFMRARRARRSTPRAPALDTRAPGPWCCSDASTDFSPLIRGRAPARSAPAVEVTYHRSVDPRRAQVVVTRRLTAILVPVITAAIALTLVADERRVAQSAVTEATCPVSLQTLIDETPTGGTLDVAGCVYRETVIVSRPMTIDGSGAVIDGRDASGNIVRAQWMKITTSDVTVRGF